MQEDILSILTFYSIKKWNDELFRYKAVFQKVGKQCINVKVTNNSPTEILLQYLVIYGIIILFFSGEAGVQRLVCI